MEACVVVGRSTKPKSRRKWILLVNAVNEVTRERARSFLTEDYIQRMVRTYERFADKSGFSSAVALEDIRAMDGNLSISLYVASANVAQQDGGL